MTEVSSVVEEKLARLRASSRLRQAREREEKDRAKATQEAKAAEMASRLARFAPVEVQPEPEPDPEPQARVDVEEEDEEEPDVEEQEQTKTQARVDAERADRYGDGRCNIRQYDYHMLPQAITERKDLNDSEKLTYGALLRTMNKYTFESRATYKSIGARINKCRRTIIYNIQMLEAKNFIRRIESGPGAANTWVFLKPDNLGEVVSKKRRRQQ